jgi:lipopolysaccharide/colanic/teichoic acid biosynthesis glycosyltransferase
MSPRLSQVDNCVPTKEAALVSSSLLAAANRAGVRTLDLLGASIGLFLLSPLLLMVGLGVRMTSPGPALFRSARVGRNARPFTIFKFRSMTAGAENVGPSITAAEDRRITPLGKKLRRTKIDELPQLLNVLRGEMSLVGPRPEAPTYVAQYSREQLGILDAKPGMTSPASLLFRDEEAKLVGDDWEERYLSEIMPAKLKIDGGYLYRRSPISDMAVIIRTIGSLLRDDTSL